MIIYGLDPGTEISALVGYDTDSKVQPIVYRATISNNEVLEILTGGPLAHLVIEEFESMGMAVGREVFKTVFWSGRFFQEFKRATGVYPAMMPRRRVKLFICNAARANDSNIRTEILDHFGGPQRAQGKKASPGPLYGLKGHEFSALALALTYHGEKIGKDSLQEIRS